MRDHDGPYGARVEGAYAEQEKAGDDSERPMGLRLTRKLAEVIDGVDLTGRAVGDILTLPASEARLLIAEGWAVEDTKGRQGTD
jgi:hypothetical protein